MKPVLEHIGKTRLELGSGAATEYGDWTLKRDSDGICWAVLDQKGRSANVVTEAVLTDLAALIDDLSATLTKALVLRSAKPSGFIAGADIDAFAGKDDPQKTAAWLERGHEVTDRLDALACKTISVIHGYAMGGGLEIALACDHRIAINGAKVGFPEVKLGLHPGLGGTFRLTELIDPVEAMTIMLTGKTVHTRKAKSLGIIDVVTDERHVRAAVHEIAKGNVERPARGLKASALDLAPSRRIAARTMRSKTEEQAQQEHYPAPYALIDLWETHAGDRQAMKKAEIASFSQLLASDTARNLIRVFHLRESLKKQPKTQTDIERVHVIGAGTMGAEIAAHCAMMGCTVSLQDIALKPLGNAINIAADVYKDAHLSGIESRDALDRLMPDPHGFGFARADLVIEAGPEKLDLKRDILADAESRSPAKAIIATNTSSILLDDLASALKKPGRLAGLHFFNPVSKMQLVEIVAHDKVFDKTMKQLSEFVVGIDRLPVKVNSYPGFLVNRALMPYLLEAALLVQEGIEPAVVDRAAEIFGMAMGPMEVADRVGLDVCMHVAESLRENLDRPLPEAPDWLRQRVAAGNLGKKTGKGVYEWKDGRPQKPETTASSRHQITDRLILPLVDACVECLRNDVVADEDTVDAALIFGAGFAPFRGGPLHYARTRGTDEIVTVLEILSRDHGDRFKPDAGWKELG